MLGELEKIAYANLCDYLLLTREELTRQDITLDGAPVSELTLSKDGSVKLKLYDKMKALELLGRSQGLFTVPEEAPESGPEEEALSQPELMRILQEAARLAFPAQAGE